MNVIFFTKPKNLTLKCVQFLNEVLRVNLKIIINGKQNFVNTSFMEYCLKNQIRVYEASEEEVFEDEIDVLVSCIYPLRIKNELIEKAKYTAINFHPAPLPDYRGVFGFNFAILNDEKEFGASVHKLEEGFDEGDILEVRKFCYDCSIGTVKELVRLTEDTMYELFADTLTKIIKQDSIQMFPQTEGKYYSRKDFEQAKEISADDSIETIEKKIRAFWYPPFEGAYIKLSGKKYMLIPTQEMKYFLDNE